MAKKAARKRRPEAAAEGSAEDGTPALDRIAALLGLYVVKDMEADEAAVKLGNVGFSDTCSRNRITTAVRALAPSLPASRS